MTAAMKPPMPDPDYTTDTAKHPFVPSNEDSALCKVCGEARNWHPSTPPLTDKRLAAYRTMGQKTRAERDLLDHIDGLQAEVERMSTRSDQRREDLVEARAEVERLKATIDAMEITVVELSDKNDGLNALAEPDAAAGASHSHVPPQANDGGASFGQEQPDAAAGGEEGK